MIDNQIHISVVVLVEQTHRLNISAGFPQRSSQQQIFVQPRHRFFERQEFHLLAVGAFGVVDALDDLVVAEPPVRMEDRGEDALCAHDGIESELPVGDGGGVGGAVGVEGFPVARDQRGNSQQVRLMT